jgi:hypothetical protein
MSKSIQVTERELSHDECLAENTAILEHVDLVLTITSSSKIYSSKNEKAGRVVQLAQCTTCKVARR